MGVELEAGPFTADAVWKGATLYITVRGELDVATRDRFNRCVHDSLDRRFDRLVLDLSGLAFIDSVGLKSVLDVWNRSRADGFPMTVVPGQLQVQRAFALSGLDALMPAETPSAVPSTDTQSPAYLHCPSCRTVREDHAGLLAGVERCPVCQTPLTPSPPSIFQDSVRHPGRAAL